MQSSAIAVLEGLTNQSIVVDSGVFKEYYIAIWMNITEGFAQLKHPGQDVEQESLVGLAQITTKISQIKCWEGGGRTALRTATES